MNLNILQSVARILSDIWNIKVIFSKNDIRTYKDCIILPYNIDIPDFIMLGYLGHEVGHVVYTDFDIVDKLLKMDVKHKQFLFAILNSLEDVRIERLIELKFCGFKKIFYDMTNVILTKKKKSKVEQILDLLFLIGRNFINNVADKYDSEIIDFVNLNLIDYLEQLNSANNTNDVLQIAKKIYDYLNMQMVDIDIDILKDNKEIKNCDANVLYSGFDDYGGNNTLNNNMIISSSGGVALGKSKVSLLKDIKKEINSKSITRYKSFKDVVKDYIQKNIENFKKEDDLTYTIHPVIEALDIKTEFVVDIGSASEYEKIKNDIQAEINVIQSHLQIYLNDQKYYRWIGNQRKGKKIDRKYLARTAVGEYKVFSKKVYSDVNDICFSLLIDESGSMYGIKLYEAQKMAIVFGEMLNSFDIPFEIIGFSSFDLVKQQKDYINKYFKYNEQSYNRCCNLRHDIFKKFDEDFNLVKYRLVNIKGSDANYEQDTLLDYVLPRLKLRNEKRKVIIVISDAQPCGGEQARIKLKNAISEIKKYAEIIAVGIQTKYLSEFYPVYIQTDVENLSLSIARLLKKVIFQNV